MFDENHRDQLPKFKLELILDDDDNMQFYPMLSDVEAAVFHVVDTVANTMQNVPTVQVIKHVSLVYNCALYTDLHCWLLHVQKSEAVKNRMQFLFSLVTSDGGLNQTQNIVDNNVAFCFQPT